MFAGRSEPRPGEDHSRARRSAARERMEHRRPEHPEAGSDRAVGSVQAGLNVSANSTIDVSYGAGVALGGLNIGTNTLNFTNASGSGASLTMGAVSLTGNPTFAPAVGVQQPPGVQDHHLVRVQGRRDFVQHADHGLAAAEVDADVLRRGRTAEQCGAEDEGQE